MGFYDRHGFIKEVVSDEDWDRLDFNASEIAADQVPFRPAQWSIDSSRTRAFLPLRSNSAMQRDGYQECVFFCEFESVKIRLEFGENINAHFSLRETFNRQHTRKISALAEEAIRAFYSISVTDVSKLRLTVIDRWAAYTDVQLASGFDLAVQGAYDSLYLKWLRNKTSRIENAFKTSWLHGKFAIWSDDEEFDVRLVSEHVALGYSDCEFERLALIVETNKFGFSEKSRQVLENIFKHGIRGAGGKDRRCP